MDEQIDETNTNIDFDLAPQSGKVGFFSGEWSFRCLYSYVGLYRILGPWCLGWSDSQGFSGGSNMFKEVHKPFKQNLKEESIAFMVNNPEGTKPEI